MPYNLQEWPLAHPFEGVLLQQVPSFRKEGQGGFEDARKVSRRQIPLNPPLLKGEVLVRE